MNDSISQFCKVWPDSIVALLGRMGVAAPSAAASEPKAADGTTQEIIVSGVCARFAGGASLKGELALCADKAATLALAQTFLSEPLTESVEFSGAHQEAFLEFARQVAGLAAAAWKQQTAQDAAISFHSASEPPFVGALMCSLTIQGDKLPPVQLNLLLNEEMRNALATQTKGHTKSHGESSAESAQSEEVEARADQTGSLPANLDLLLDVELEATIRFGEREMLLKEIYGLMPGTVIELDQMINEPAQLLVAGRTVAWGEVVVVDGNFGLRVTEVASKGQRVEMVPL